MLTTRKLLIAGTLLSLLSILATTPAYAFDGRGGDNVTIPAGQVINDDLYVGATEFVLDGTVNGDVVAFAQAVTINGAITGDLITAAQTVVINGSVAGNVRMAGGILFVGEKAKIGGDVVGAGYSLELRKGSSVGRDLVVGTGQTLLAGDVARNVLASAGSLEIAGNVGGNVKAEVGEASQAQSGPPPSMFFRQSTVPVPIVKPGLTIDPAAKIKGNLDYTQDTDLTIPAGVVAGKITHSPRPVEQNQRPPEKTSQQKVADWALRSLRSLVTLLLIGLLLLWLFPIFTGAVSAQLEHKPLPSLGWGVVTYAGFFFTLMVIFFVTVIAAIVFGLLTLGGLSASIVVLGLLALLTLITAFVLTVVFLAKIVFGLSLGRWLLGRLNSPLAGHRYWPMVIGMAITVVVVALLTFPLIPGVLGWLVNLAIVLMGLGALWLWGRDKASKKPEVLAS